MLTCWWMKSLRKLAERKKDVSVFSFQGFLPWLAASSTGAWGRAEHCNSWSLSPRGCSLHGDKETKTWGKGEGVLQEYPSRVLPPAVSGISQKPIQLQIHWWAYSSHDPGISEKCYTNPNYNGFLCHVFKYFLNGLCAPVLYLFYICFKENSRFIVDIISFLFSSYTNSWFTSVKKFSILGVLERWLGG